MQINRITEFINALLLLLLVCSILEIVLVMVNFKKKCVMVMVMKKLQCNGNLNA